MNNSISNLLEEIAADDCVSFLIGISNKSMLGKKESILESTEVNRRVLQYFIDLMGCSYQLDEFSDADLDADLNNLALKVFNSQTEEGIECNNTSSFLSSLVETISENGILCSYINTCFDFLTTYIHHKQIPEGSKSANIAFLLLSYHLHPFTSCYVNSKDLDPPRDPLADEDEEEEDLLSHSIQSIMQGLPRGLTLSPETSEEIALQFLHAMESFFETFVLEDWNFLSVYREFFSSDNDEILLSGIESIQRLFLNEDIHDQLFVFLEEIEDDEASAMEILNFRFKNSKSGRVSSSITQFFKSIDDLKLNQSKETRMEYYKSKMAGGRHDDWEELIKTMNSLEDDVLFALVHTLEEVQATERFMQRFVETMLLEHPDLKIHLFHIVNENIEDRRQLAYRAAQVFEIAAHNNNDDEFVTSGNTLKILKSFIDDEQIFGAISTTFLNTDCFKIVANAGEVMKVGKTLVCILVEAFQTFKDPIVLHKILLSLRTIGDSFAKFTVPQLHSAFGSLYGKFLEGEVNEVIRDVKSTDSVTILKMILLMESKMLDLLDYFKCDAITIINSNHLTDVKDPMFPYYARFQISVLHSILLKIVASKTVENQERFVAPLKLKDIAVIVKDLAGKLMRFMKRRDLGLFEAQLVFTCLMRALHLFQIRPTLQLNSSIVFFMTCPEVTSKNTKDIINFAKHYVFRIDGDSKGIEYQRNILKELIGLVRGALSLPSRKSLSMIIRYLSGGRDFIPELETLINILFRFKNKFPSIIGLAILQLPNSEEVEEFMTLIGILFKAWNDGDGKSSAKWKICSFLLENMKIANNRSYLVKAIKMLGKGIKPQALAKLEKRIQHDAFSASEQAQLESLKELFSNTFTID